MDDGDRRGTLLSAAAAFAVDDVDGDGGDDDDDDGEVLSRTEYDKGTEPYHSTSEKKSTDILGFEFRSLILHVTLV